MRFPRVAWHFVALLIVTAVLATTMTGTAMSDPTYNAYLGTDAADDVATLTPQRDIAVGYGGNDTFYGLGGADRLYGGGGNDSLFGGDGAAQLVNGISDMLYGGLGDDLLSGGKGNDQLESGEGNDTVSGGLGNDLLVDNAGADRLAGGVGNDQIYDHGGTDRIAGGPGNDRINTSDLRRDFIDCGPGRDQVVVDRIDTTRNCETVTVGGAFGGVYGVPYAKPKSGPSSTVFKVQLIPYPERKVEYFPGFDYSCEKCADRFTVFELVQGPDAVNCARDKWTLSDFRGKKVAKLQLLPEAAQMTACQGIYVWRVVVLEIDPPMFCQFQRDKTSIPFEPRTIKIGEAVELNFYECRSRRVLGEFAVRIK